MLCCIFLLFSSCILGRENNIVMWMIPLVLLSLMHGNGEWSNPLRKPFFFVTWKHETNTWWKNAVGIIKMKTKHTHTHAVSPPFFGGAERDSKNNFKQKNKAQGTLNIVSCFIFCRLTEIPQKTCPNVSQNTLVLEVFFVLRVHRHAFVSLMMIIYGYGELFMFINWTKAVDVFCYTCLLCYFIHLVVLWLLGHSNARGSLTKILCVSLLTPGGAQKKPEKLVPRSINIPDPFELITTYPPGLLNQWIKQWMITQTNISPIGIKSFMILTVWFHTP